MCLLYSVRPVLNCLQALKEQHHCYWGCYTCAPTYVRTCGLIHRWGRAAFLQSLSNRRWEVLALRIQSRFDNSFAVREATFMNCLWWLWIHPVTEAFKLSIISQALSNSECSPLPSCASFSLTVTWPYSTRTNSASSPRLPVLFTSYSCVSLQATSRILSVRQKDSKDRFTRRLHSG